MLRCALISLVFLTAGITPWHSRAAAQQPASEQSEAEAADLAKRNAQAARTRALQLQLNDATRERSEASTLLPWVLTGSGVAMLVLGVAVGAAGSLDCEHSCRGPAWPALLVIGGGTLASAGVLWVSLATREIHELDARRHDLEYQLQNQRWDSAQRSGGPRIALLLHGAF